MRRSPKRLSLPVTLLAAGLLAAGCGGTISSSIGSLPSRTATAPARPSVTAAPATQPQATGSAAPVASSGTSLIWLWVLLGVLVLAGLIALIARSSRRRSAAAAGWRSRLVDAYAKGSALHDAMSVAEAPGGLATADAAARWSDIQRRADDLAQTLYALREEVPQHSPDGSRIADTLASLQAVRSAMDAERAPGGASLEQANVVRSRLAVLRVLPPRTRGSCPVIARTSPPAMNAGGRIEQVRHIKGDGSSPGAGRRRPRPPRSGRAQPHLVRVVSSAPAVGCPHVTRHGWHCRVACPATGRSRARRRSRGRGRPAGTGAAVRRAGGG